MGTFNNQTFEISQPGRRTILVTESGDALDVDVLRPGATDGYRNLGHIEWMPEFGPLGSWCGFINPAAFMPNGNEPEHVVMASVPTALYNGDPETGDQRTVATADYGNPMDAAKGIVSWCINGRAPALGYIPHTWPIRGRGRGLRATIADLVGRMRGNR